MQGVFIGLLFSYLFANIIFLDFAVNHSFERIEKIEQNKITPIIYGNRDTVYYFHGDGRDTIITCHYLKRKP